jgi:opacity protein-like surface antigen
MKALLMKTRGAAALACVLLAAVPAVAQDVRRVPAVSGERGYLTGGAAISLNGANAPGFSFEIAERMGRAGQAYVNFLYVDDVMADGTRDQVAALGTFLTDFTATPWSFTARDRARAFSAGGRLLLPTGPIRPFVGAGIGALNIKRIIVERARGNVTDEVLSRFVIGDTVIDATQASTTRPMLEGLGGVAAVIGRLHVEGTYRYRRALHAAERLDLSQAGIAVGVSF